MDKDEGVLRRTREMLGAPPQVVYLHADYSDPAVTVPYVGKTDRVYLIHPNRFSKAMAPARAVLKPGGLLIMQHAISTPLDDPEGLSGDRGPLITPEDYEVCVALKNVAPIFKTHSAGLFPAGNFFLIARRNLAPR